MVSDDEFKELVLAKLGAIATDVGVLKSDVATLKTDVATLKTDVATLKTDVESLKATTALLEVRVGRLERETFHHATSHTRDIAQLRSDLTFFTLSFDTRLSALEQGWTEIAQGLRELTATNAALLHHLVDHEGRIRRLEGAG